MEIKSITDVVTNSSSEVFIMRNGYADRILERYPQCTSVYKLSIDYIKEQYLDSDLYLSALAELDYDIEKKSSWKETVDEYLEDFKEFSEGYSCVEIDDHGIDYEEASSFAYGYSVAYTNTHLL